MHRWNVAQLVRLPDKTKRSWVQPPTFHRVYDIILPIRPRVLAYVGIVDENREWPLEHFVNV